MFKLKTRKKKQGCGKTNKAQDNHGYADDRRHEMLGVFGLMMAAVPGRSRKGSENW